MTQPAFLDVFIVTYWPRPDQIERLLLSLKAQSGRTQLRVHFWDNTCDPQGAQRLAPLRERYRADFAELNLHFSDRNSGFGVGNNQLLERSNAEFVLLLNPDAALLPGALDIALAAIPARPQAAAWEFRQRPFEHPKHYHPISQETSWVSGAAVILRRAALDEIGGFDSRLFLYGEDVDLSWRLRARGWKLIYLVDAGAIHDSYTHAGQEKPQQTLGSTFANLCLRVRFGTRAELWAGLRMLCDEILARPSFPGRRVALLRNLLRFLKHYRHFARSRVAANEHFAPLFAGWDFEHRRKGTFLPVVDASTFAERPLVSILIRTHRRPGWVREAIQSAAQQTYPNIEIVVVEDGEPIAKAMIEREFGQLPNLRYHATGKPVGRALAGNLAMQLATGEWCNFLDDDDLLYPDHVETLMDTALRERVPGVYGIAWEVPTERVSEEPLRYRESAPAHRYQMPFNHLTLWVHNYIPIQCALFKRELYLRHGGFEEDMDQLEDWNLWTRYTLDTRFELVDKTTSLYRVPLCADASQSRQIALDLAYKHALARQRQMRVNLDPRSLMEELVSSTIVPRPPRPETMTRRVLNRFPPTRWVLYLRDRMVGFR
jgi:GT2 family glycosyltransferase